MSNECNPIIISTYNNIAILISNINIDMANLKLRVTE